METPDLRGFSILGPLKVSYGDPYARFDEDDPNYDPTRETATDEDEDADRITDADLDWAK